MSTESSSTTLASFQEMRSRLEELCTAASLAEELAHSTPDLHSRLLPLIEAYVATLSEPHFFRTLLPLRHHRGMELSLNPLLRFRAFFLSSLPQGDEEHHFALSPQGRLWYVEWDNDYEAPQIKSLRPFSTETATPRELDCLLASLTSALSRYTQRITEKVASQESSSRKLEELLTPISAPRR